MRLITFLMEERGLVLCGYEAVLVLIEPVGLNIYFFTSTLAVVCLRSIMDGFPNLCFFFFFFNFDLLLQGSSFHSRMTG